MEYVLQGFGAKENLVVKPSDDAAAAALPSKEQELHLLVSGPVEGAVKQLVLRCSQQGNNVVTLEGAGQLSRLMEEGEPLVLGNRSADDNCVIVVDGIAGAGEGVAVGLKRQLSQRVGTQQVGVFLDANIEQGGPCAAASASALPRALDATGEQLLWEKISSGAESELYMASVKTGFLAAEFPVGTAAGAFTRYDVNMTMVSALKEKLDVKLNIVGYSERLSPSALSCMEHLTGWRCCSSVKELVDCLCVLVAPGTTSMDQLLSCSDVALLKGAKAFREPALLHRCDDACVVLIDFEWKPPNATSTLTCTPTKPRMGAAAVEPAARSRRRRGGTPIVFSLAQASPSAGGSSMRLSSSSRPGKRSRASYMDLDAPPLAGSSPTKHARMEWSQAYQESICGGLGGDLTGARGKGRQKAAGGVEWASHTS